MQTTIYKQYNNKINPKNKNNYHSKPELHIVYNENIILTPVFIFNYFIHLFKLIVLLKLEIL